MNDEVSSGMASDENRTVGGDAAATAPTPFHIGAVLKVIVPIVLLGVGAVLFFGFFDGPQWIADLMAPARVPVTGQVLFNGEPLPGAVIGTRLDQGGIRGALATTDEQGRFKLITEVKGDFLDGAFAGEHRVTVKGYHDIPSMGEKPLRTPKQYASFETTPLRISVSATQHEVKLELTGTPSERPAGPGFVPGSQRPPPSSRPGGRAPAEKQTPPQEQENPVPKVGDQ